MGSWIGLQDRRVATVLTVYGIETDGLLFRPYFKYKLQQYLPFTVLKLVKVITNCYNKPELQQYLPFTVLKRY